MRNLVNIMVWTSLIIGIFILLTFDMWGAAPFFINAILATIYLGNNDRTLSYIGCAVAIVMMLINATAPISVVDTIAWGTFSFVWIKNTI